MIRLIKKSITKIVISFLGLFFKFPNPLNGHVNFSQECLSNYNEVQFYTERFIEKAKRVHGDKYNYDKVNYINSGTKVIINCPTHGDFEQRPHTHLRGCGCPKCGRESSAKNNTDTLEGFIEKAREVHGDKYNYDKVNYINRTTKVIINCPTHGDFEQLPSSHLVGCGCPKCGIESSIKNNTDTLEGFIEKAREVHGDKYNYDKVNYINSGTKVIINCPTHGDFEQLPYSHLNGRGCPACSSSKLETIVRQYLILNGIQYEEQKTWNWLIYKKPQYVDFYLPELNIAIECQGIQHFKESRLFDVHESLTERINKDINKQRLCLENGIWIYYFSNLSSKDNMFNYPYLVFEDIGELIQAAANSNPLSGFNYNSKL